MVALLIETWRYFQSHDGRLLSGAIAFYASLAIAPLGVVALLMVRLSRTSEMLFRRLAYTSQAILIAHAGG